MASRKFFSIIPRTVGLVRPSRIVVPHQISLSPRRSQPILSQFSQTRSHSAPSGLQSRVYNFSDVKAIADAPSADRILVDVREPGEYTAGCIPGAINIPVVSQPDALLLPPDEFEDRFGFEKPSKDAEVVFYCKVGVRSSAAAQIAVQEGYGKVAEYRGSWMDWVKNNESA